MNELELLREVAKAAYQMKDSEHRITPSLSNALIRLHEFIHKHPDKISSGSEEGK